MIHALTAADRPPHRLSQPQTAHDIPPTFIQTISGSTAGDENCGCRWQAAEVSRPCPTAGERERHRLVELACSRALSPPRFTPTLRLALTRVAGEHASPRTRALIGAEEGVWSVCSRRGRA